MAAELAAMSGSKQMRGRSVVFQTTKVPLGTHVPKLIAEHIVPLPKRSRNPAFQRGWYFSSKSAIVPLTLPPTAAEFKGVGQAAGRSLDTGELSMCSTRGPGGASFQRRATVHADG